MTTERERLEAALRELVAEWRKKVSDGNGPTDRLIGYNVCADMLEAALAASVAAGRAKECS